MEGGIRVEDLSAIVYYEKPFLTFERLLETYISFAPRGFSSFLRAMPVWLKQKLGLRSMLKHEFKTHFGVKKSQLPPLYFSYHHLSHAASSFYPSPFDSAAILCMDGVGEWATTSVWRGRGSTLEPLLQIDFPHSIGLLYSAFTFFCGFKVNSGEYKLMGLAPYGEPRFRDIILENLIDLKDDGSFRLDMEYFDFAVGLKMTNDKFAQLFGCKPRKSEDPYDPIYIDLAASIQSVTEEVVLRMGKAIRVKTGEKNLCLAGGVALNCVANGKLQNARIFENVWVQPAAGDAGGAVGAALAYWHLGQSHHRLIAKAKDGMKNGYLGPEFSQEAIESYLLENKITFEVMNTKILCKEVARLLADGKVVGWFRGRMEYGPRALGARSILADPRSVEMQHLVNRKVKFRESFRPLAPVVLKERAQDFFVSDSESPYMLMTFPVSADKLKALSMAERQAVGLEKLRLNRSVIASVTHVDQSSRVQTISREDNPAYYALIEEFEKLTGVPVLINTSFNVRGEPIVCTPKEAMECFKNTDIDFLVMGDCLIDKTLQEFPKKEAKWSAHFLPD
jgi:carbamoyltransferase